MPIYSMTYVCTTEVRNPYKSCAIPSSEFFDIEFQIEGDPCDDYLVNKENGNLYAIPHQGGCSAYQIKNNQIVQRLPYLGPSGLSYDWR